MTFPSPSQLWRAALDAHRGDPFAARDAYRTSMLELGYIEPGMPMTAPMPCGWPHYPDLDPEGTMRRAEEFGECGLCTDPYAPGDWVVPLRDVAFAAHLDCARHTAGRGRLKPAPLGQMKLASPPIIRGETEAVVAGAGSLPRHAKPIEARRSPRPGEPTLDVSGSDVTVLDFLLVVAVVAALAVLLWFWTA